MQGRHRAEVQWGQDLPSQLPGQALNPGLWQRKCGILTPGPPGNPLVTFFFGWTRSSLLHGGLFAGCGGWSSHCRGFCCGSWALGCVDSVVAFRGFRAQAQ